MARLRRGLSTVLFAERMNISRDTLNRLEKGDLNVALGTYLRALRILGLDRDIDAVAKDDELGRKLQDAKLGGVLEDATLGATGTVGPPPHERKRRGGKEAPGTSITTPTGIKGSEFNGDR